MSVSDVSSGQEADARTRWVPDAGTSTEEFVEDLDQVRVELAPRLDLEQAERHFETSDRSTHGWIVRRDGCPGEQGVEGIGDGENPRSQGDVGTSQAIRIPASVPAFVVMGDPEGGLTQPGDGLQQFHAKARMTLDQGILVM